MAAPSTFMADAYELDQLETVQLGYTHMDRESVLRVASKLLKDVDEDLSDTNLNHFVEKFYSRIVENDAAKPIPSWVNNLKASSHFDKLQNIGVSLMVLLDNWRLSLSLKVYKRKGKDKLFRSVVVGGISKEFAWCEDTEKLLSADDGLLLLDDNDEGEEEGLELLSYDYAGRLNLCTVVVDFVASQVSGHLIEPEKEFSNWLFAERFVAALALTGI